MDTENMQDISKEQLRACVKSIVEDIENGIQITADNIEEWDEDGEYRIGDYVSGLDYTRNVLDIEYTTDSKKQYLGVKLLLVFGGPNIWIDTKNQKVIGAWWGDYFEMDYTKDMFDLDDYFEEIFNCI